METFKVTNIVANQACLKQDGDIYTYFDDAHEQQRIEQFLVAFELHRQKEKGLVLNSSLLTQLPFIKQNAYWKIRQETLSIVKNTLQKGNYTMLEIGAWNGWLSKYLAELTPNFVAVDYFTNAQDGIKAVKHYKQQWPAIQCNLSNLNFFTIKFDVIVVNHCMAYTSNPHEFINNLKKMLMPNGKLLLMGFPVTNQPQKKITQLAKMDNEFKQQYGMSLFINLVKGYLTYHDLSILQKNGFSCFAYKCNFVHKLKQLILPWQEVQHYAIGSFK